MPDWSALRRRAYEQHLRLRDRIDAPENALVHADLLLGAAEETTGFAIQSLPAGDPLLAGAQAFLDRDSEMIWFGLGGDLSPERQRFAQAHEFAHLWLHRDVELDEILPDDTPVACTGSALTTAAQIEEGYSPRERREREANLFAAELLLPSAILRNAYIEQGLRAKQIADATGLSETCVLSQLGYALLVPTIEAPRTAPSSIESATNQTVALDASQEQATRIQAGPVLIDAGPGTGKTRTLTARIVHLIRDCGVPPENILALTFSNHAAEEMMDRLLAAVGETAHRVWVGTFHAFGFELLRKEGGAIGLPPYPSLIETADAMLLLERNLDALDLTEYEYLSNPTLPFADILSAISRAKDELKNPEDYRRAAEAMALAAVMDADRTEAAKAGEVANVYAVYQRLLSRQGLLDYGDLIAQSVDLLEAHPEVRDRWQRRYPHILADEYQDVNRATARLLALLAGDGKGLWAVGDLRQAIYRFRGASPANIRRFESDFPGGQRLSLDYNYRSRPGLVRVFSGMALAMASGAEARHTWTPFRREELAPSVVLAAPADEMAQGDWLAEQIQLRVAGGLSFRDQAILVPTNRHAAEIGEMLGRRGIPVHFSGSLFDRPEIKDLLALLSLASEPDGLALIRVAKYPEYQIPEADTRSILADAGEANRPFPTALPWALENVELSDIGRTGLARLCETLLPIAYRGDAWLVLSRYLFETSEYLAPFLQDHSAPTQQKLLAIHQFLLTVQQMTDRLKFDNREKSRTGLLDRLRKLLQLQQSRSVRIPDTGAAIDAVRIMTIHASKGLEFPVVYLPNLIKGQFPARGRGAMATLPMALTDEGESSAGGEEEMFFVALSRARDEMLLSSPRSWRGKPVEPAPLLERLSSTLEAEGLTWAIVTAGEMKPTGEHVPILEVVTSNESAQSATITADKPEISLSRIRQYQNCPRQYYYRYVLALPERDEDTAYRTFYRHLQDTLDWLQAERSAGRSPAIADMQAGFQDRWPDDKPEEETGLTRVLRHRADRLLGNAHSQIARSGRETSTEAFRVELENGAIKLRGDEVESLADGGIRITQHVHRRPKKDDHTAEPLALIRLAAKQRAPGRFAEVALLSTATGEIREVAEDRRWEPKRVEKYEAALRDLAAGRFPPKPSEMQCASCPYFFICPA